MFTLPNIISLTRFPLAFLFLSEDVTVRCVALALAGLSDVLDGLIARQFNMRSSVGTSLDPIMDKFFVLFVLVVLVNEGSLQLWEAATMLSRDFALLLFGSYLAYTGNLATYRFRSLWWGKATTFLQFIVLLLASCYYTVPPYIFTSFIALGVCALIELSLTKKANV